MERHRILITGCRHWRCDALAATVVARLRERHGEALVVVHGMAEGVDSAFHDACVRAGVAVEPHPARWDDIERPGARVRRRRDGKLYDADAGPRRNQEMLDTGPAACIAVHRDLAGSRGTRDMVRRCLAAGVPVWLLDTDTDDQVRPKRIMEI